MDIRGQELKDQTGVCFDDARWLKMNPLTKSNVLEYFSLSPFYSKTSNNEIIRMQQLDPDKLLDMNGIQYSVVHHKEPTLFVIQKHKRENRRIVIPLAMYYILDGVIFQAPDFYSILSSRMLKTIFRLKDAFEEISRSVSFDPYTGYSWNSDHNIIDSQKVKVMPMEEKNRLVEEESRLRQSLRYVVQKLLPDTIEVQGHKRKLDELNDTSSNSNSGSQSLIDTTTNVKTVAQPSEK